jgi:hypothetical protein
LCILMQETVRIYKTKGELWGGAASARVCRWLTVVSRAVWVGLTCKVTFEARVEEEGHVEDGNSQHRGSQS